MAKTRFDSEAEKQVYRFMLQLGYPESLIRKAVKTARGYRADFVVYDDLDEPLLVIEVKSNLQLPDPNNEQELKFHPIIRQIQTYAKDLGALYYLLTDGDEYLWFTTAPTGRPRLLDSPITYQQVRTDYPPLKPSKESLLTIFRRVIDVGRNEFSVYNTHEYAIVIFARLLEERGDDRFSIALLEPILQNDREPPFNEIGFSASEFRERKFYYKSLKILSEITISAGIPQDILFALDEVFINPLIRLEPRIPRWLANFIVSLEDINTSASVVDLSCGYGDIIAAAILRNRQHPPRSLIGITQNSQAALWARIQELVLDRKHDNILLRDIIYATKKELNAISSPSHIFSAPEFGRKRISSPEKIDWLIETSTNSEDIYLQLALGWIGSNGKIVMLVPEKLLFGGGTSKKIREFIVQNGKIYAIISLPAGALKPISGLKTSILVLGKGDQTSSYNIFMAHLDDFRLGDTFNIEELTDVNSVLKSYQSWKETGEISTNSFSWTISIDEIDIENFTVTRYMPTEILGLAELKPPYPMLPLTKVTKSIKRGKPIKLDDEGNIPVIGPAAIRMMNIDGENIRTTSEGNLPKNPIRLKSGDVILNNIGTQLGAAVGIDDRFDRYLVSQHVLVIRPDTSLVLPEFLAAALNSGFVKTQLQRRATGVLIPSLTIGRFTEIEVPIPSIEVQSKVIENINRSREALELARTNFERAETEFERAIKHLISEEGEE